MLERNLILIERSPTVELHYVFWAIKDERPSNLMSRGFWDWAGSHSLSLVCCSNPAVSLSNLQCVADSCREEERATADVVQINTQLFSLLIHLQIPPSSPPLFQQPPLITVLYLCFPFVMVSVECYSLCESVSGFTCLLECVYLSTAERYMYYMCVCVCNGNFLSHFCAVSVYLMSLLNDAARFRNPPPSPAPPV